MEPKDYSKLFQTDQLKSTFDIIEKVKQGIPQIDIPKIDTERFSKALVDTESYLDNIVEISQPSYDLSTLAIPVEPDPLIRQSQEAALETAQNTKDIKEQQYVVIDLLKKQLEVLTDQNIELRKIFYSSEDKANVEKAILKVLENQGVNSKELTIDKGIDAVLTALSIIISSKGLL